jgi:CHRD domain
MKMIGLKFLLLTIAVFTMTAGAGAHDDDDLIMRGSLSGLQEVASPVNAPNGSLARGRFSATLDDSGTSLNYKLSWTNFPAGTVIRFAHIHFAMPGVSGGIMVFLCNNTVTPNLSLCPLDSNGSGMATGTITAANIINTLNGGVSQGIPAGDFAGFLRVMRSGEGYANIHTNAYPGGEIRGQITVFPDRDDRDDHDDHDRYDRR